MKRFKTPVSKSPVRISLLILVTAFLSACGPNTSGQFSVDNTQNLAAPATQNSQAATRREKPINFYSQSKAPAAAPAASAAAYNAYNTALVSSAFAAAPTTTAPVTQASNSATLNSAAKNSSSDKASEPLKKSTPIIQTPATAVLHQTVSPASNAASNSAVKKVDAALLPPDALSFRQTNLPAQNSATPPHPANSNTTSNQASSPTNAQAKKSALSSNLPSAPLTLSGPAVSPASKELNQMASIWMDEDNTQSWTDVVLKLIHKHFAQFDSAKDTETFCPGYSDATHRQKEICWLRIIGAVVFYESHFSPTDTFREPSTGNLSIGLLSLSPKECDNAPTPDALTNPIDNLVCGTLKMADLISTSKYIDGPDHIGASHYWSTLREPYDYAGYHIGKKEEIIDLTNNYQEFK